MGATIKQFETAWIGKEPLDLSGSHLAFQLRVGRRPSILADLGPRPLHRSVLGRDHYVGRGLIRRIDTLLSICLLECFKTCCVVWPFVIGMITTCAVIIVPSHVLDGTLVVDQSKITNSLTSI